jgi:hypothetical protein
MITEKTTNRLKMKSYNFWLVILAIIASTAMNIGITKYLIEKHSVHPVYGNNLVLTSGSCQPWDDCR